MERLEINGLGETTVGPQVLYGPLAQQRLYEAERVRPRYFWLYILLILALGLVVRVWHLGTASLWTDEVLSAVRAEAPLGHSFSSIVSAGNQAPFYFISLQLLPNYSEAMLRLPSVLMGMLGILLVILIGIRLYGNYHYSLWAGAFLAVNPFHVWLSRTARPYALIFVLALLVSYCFLMIIRGRRTWPWWAGLMAASIAIYLTHYSAAALLTAQGVLLVLTQRRDRTLIKKWITAQVICVVPTLLWLYFVFRHPIVAGPEWVPVPHLKDIPLTFWSMTVGYTGVFKWYLVPSLIIVGYGLVFSLYYAVRERHQHAENFYWFWLIATPLLPTFLISAFLVSYYVDRYFMVFLPALVFLIPFGWKDSPARLRQLALAVVLLTGLHNILFTFQSGYYHRADWRGAAHYVAREYQPGDEVVLERTNTEQAFMRYYDDTTDVSPALTLLTAQGDQAKIDPGARRLWVVYRNPNEDVHRQGAMPDFNPFEPGRTALGDWLITEQERVIQQRRFNGVTVILLDMSLQPVAAEGP